MSFAQTEPNQITIIGTAEQEIEPDWILLGMTAKETENTKRESEVVTMENSILNFLTSIELEPDAFSIDRYSVNTKYSYSPYSKFKLSKSYKLKVENITLLDTIIAKCFEYGMDNIYVNQVGHSEIDSIQNLVLTNALVSAKDKGSLIAKTMEVKLGKVVSVDESYQLVNNQVGSYNYGDFRLEDVVVTGYGTSYKGRVGSSLSFQKIKVSKTVIVKYAIE